MPRLDSPPPFSLTRSPEPHTVRRKRILAKHPEIRELYGWDRWAVPWMLAAVVAQLALAGAVGRAFDPDALGTSIGGLVLLVLTVGAVLSHASSMFIHEAAHDSAAATPRANKLWAVVANTSQVVPGAMTFRKYHLRHHGHLGTLGVDADLPADWEVDRLPATPWMKATWLLFNFGFWVARGWERRTATSREEWLNGAWMLAVNLLILATLGPVAWTYLLLSTLVGHSFHPVAGHFLHEHFVFEPGQETNSYYGILNKVTYNVGYHVEHHDFPRIPGRRLPAFKARYSQYYDGLISHRSWTCVLLRFVRDPAMGWTRRIARADRRGGQWNHHEAVPTPALIGHPGGLA